MQALTLFHTLHAGCQVCGYHMKTSFEGLHNHGPGFLQLAFVTPLLEPFLHP
jgi:hypothetical protein